jgi:hypothetical protein
MKALVVSAIASLLCSSFALADDAAWTYVGGAGNFSNNKQIRMVSERVDVRLRDKRSHFHAEFVFRNEGPATSVQMAFPEAAHGHPPKTKGVIRGFYSTVDGSRVRVKRHAQKIGSYQGSEYYAVWLKRVHFNANQTRRVAVDYWADNGDIGDFVQNNYILKTGATWKGNIGDCLVSIDWSGLHDATPTFTLERGRRWDPAGPKSALPKHVELRYRDFEPDFDISMNWSNYFWNFVVNGDYVEGYGMADRMPLVEGDPRDPVMIARLVPAVFSYSFDEEHLFPAIGAPFKVGKHTVRVLSRSAVQIDGERKRLRRAGPMVRDYQGVYLRDVVEAIGGKYTFVKRQGIVYINLR